jgi:hypothetical protein
MADRLLFVTWNAPARGLEERAVEVFNDALGILGRRQQEGSIESFDVSLFFPTGDIGGYMIAKGSAEQISALRNDPEFMRNTVDAELCVEGIRHIEGFCENAIAEQMTMYNEAVGRLPQHA